MTTEELQTVSRLQQNGLGYKKIAVLTGINVNTIKAHCRRHRTEEPDKAMGSGRFCRGCGKPVEIVAGRKPRQFCSDTCRMKWWNAHPTQVHRKAYYTFTCPQCGRSFESYGNEHRIFCSRVCAGLSRRKGSVGDGC